MKNSLSVAVLSRVVASLIGIASTFISIKLYNLYVSKEIYGAIVVGLVIIGYLPTMSAGFRMVINQRMLAEPDLEAAKLTARFGQALQTYFLLFVLLAGMLIMAVYSQLPTTRPLALPFLVFIATGAAAAFTFQAGSQLALLVAFGEQVISTWIQTLWGLMGLFILWASFRVGGGVWAFPTSIGLGALLTILCVRLALIKTNHDVPLLVWHRSQDFWERFKSIWRPSFDSLHNQIAMAVMFSSDIVMVGILIGPGPAAVYGTVTRIAGLSRTLLQSISEAAWPRLTQELDSQRKATMMRKVDRLNAWSVGCWYGAMAATLLPFLGFILKADWLASPLLADLVIMRGFIISLASPHSYGLMSAGRFKDLARLSQQEAIIGLVLGVILSLTVGVIGTALAYLLASCVMSAWQQTMQYFKFAEDTHWFAEWCAIWWRGLVGAGAGLGIAAAVWSVEQRTPHMPGYWAILAGGIGYGLPMGLVLLWWRLAKRVP